MLINDHEQYNRVSFNDEAEIEDVVRKFASSLFGTHIVYLPQQKITTLGGTGTVPDAIVIDLKAEQWYLVEAERGCHGTWQHIAPQVSKQLAALSSPAMRNSLLKLTLDQISQNAALRQVFAELGIPDIEVHGKLQAILAKPATIAIPIDEVPVDMNDWLVTLRNSAKVWVLGKYVSASDPKHVLYSLPDEALPTMATVSTQDGSKITVSRSQLYQKLLSSGLMPEGTVLTMDYGPRGKPRRTFRGIVRKNGIEVEGRMYSSPSVRLPPSAWSRLAVLLGRQTGGFGGRHQMARQSIRCTRRCRLRRSVLAIGAFPRLNRRTSSTLCQTKPPQYWLVCPWKSATRSSSVAPRCTRN
jgi:hypothetical protein